MTKLTSSEHPWVLLGGGGHAQVLIGILRDLRVEIKGIIDPKLEPATNKWGLPILGGDEVVAKLENDALLVNGLGVIGCLNPRSKIFQARRKEGFGFPNIVSPTAYVSNLNVRLGDGVQILTGAVVHPGSTIGDNCVINKAAIIEL